MLNTKTSWGSEYPRTLCLGVGVVVDHCSVVTCWQKSQHECRCWLVLPFYCWMGHHIFRAGKSPRVFTISSTSTKRCQLVSVRTGFGDFHHWLSLPLTSRLAALILWPASRTMLDLYPFQYFFKLFKQVLLLRCGLLIPKTTGLSHFPIEKETRYYSIFKLEYIST